MDVLVIENEEFFAENLCHFLRKIKQVHVQYVTKVDEAFKLLTHKKFDVVLSDLRLPDAPTENWLLEVGNIMPGQKVIVISSYPVPNEVSASEKLEIIGYFEKPFDVNKIVGLINQYNN